MSKSREQRFLDHCCIGGLIQFTVTRGDEEFVVYAKNAEDACYQVFHNNTVGAVARPSDLTRHDLVSILTRG